MKEAVLIVIKPDGMKNGIAGVIIDRFLNSKLKLVAIKAVEVTRSLAEEHYQQIKGKPFFAGTVRHMMGEIHGQKQVIAFILSGSNAVKKCRDITGATNPEEADPQSIRGAFGRVTTKGIYENLVHASSSTREAEREIKLWFSPDEMTEKIYPTRPINTKKRTWL